ncbi:MarR family winged helix-turn-helix transcriptional regulator [Paracraurococcus lichenis]|uniref:MarR family transcriptional regulator n=1 Tax=Paracraurococcus lichenis TaxID=3064888 RepID=A0ABT9E1W5_9PROT|nr:MarR family transcriptional regulator [Paracraurococcus sp. LOR1-02]MDO9710133.1 MarR family transcriptional regulator [Paracraurococcus sp. LOR1-02]
MPSTDDRRHIGFLIADVARLMRASFDRRVRRIGLTRSQWLVLSRLHRHPGISQSELAEMLEVERATAGRMVDRMERRGWLVRRPDPADRRVNRLHLTEEAERVQTEMGLIAERFLDDALAELEEAERAALTGMLERVKATVLAMGARRPAEAERRPGAAP